MTDEELGGQLDGAERGRIVASGRRRDGDRPSELLVVWELDGSWTFYAPPDWVGVTLSRVEALFVAESIVERCGRDPVTAGAGSSADGSGAPRPMSREPYDRWRDTDGVHIPDQCRVEQVAVASEHGAAPSRLHQCGEVIGRGTNRVNVRFDGEAKMASVRPHLLRVLDGPGS